MERATAIFDFLERNIDFNTDPIAKSEFQKVGISPKDMDNWIELILMIQSKPRLIVKKKGNRTYLDYHDNKFTLYMKKIYSNQDRVYEERKSAILLYFNALLALEKMKGEFVDIDNIVNENWQLDRPTVVRMTEEALSQVDRS